MPLTSFFDGRGVCTEHILKVKGHFVELPKDSAGKLEGIQDYFRGPHYWISLFLKTRQF